MGAGGRAQQDADGGPAAREEGVLQDDPDDLDAGGRAVHGQGGGGGGGGEGERQGQGGGHRRDVERERVVLGVDASPHAGGGGSVGRRPGGQASVLQDPPEPPGCCDGLHHAASDIDRARAGHQLAGPLPQGPTAAALGDGPDAGPNGQVQPVHGRGKGAPVQGLADEQRHDDRGKLETWLDPPSEFKRFVLYVSQGLLVLSLSETGAAGDAKAETLPVGGGILRKLEGLPIGTVGSQMVVSTSQKMPTCGE